MRRPHSATSMALEALHGTLVLLGRRPRLEGAEIATPAGFRVQLPGIEPIAARLELADHRRLPSALRIMRARARLCAVLAIASLLRWFGFCQPRRAGKGSTYPGDAAELTKVQAQTIPCLPMLHHDCKRAPSMRPSCRRIGARKDVSRGLSARALPWFAALEQLFERRHDLDPAEYDDL